MKCYLYIKYIHRNIAACQIFHFKVAAFAFEDAKGARNPKSDP